jgi:acyl carrier protein
MVEAGPSRDTSERLAALGEAERPVLPSLPDADAPGAATELLAGALAFLWAAGVRVDWAAYHGGWDRRRVELPTYPFERQYFWLLGKPKPGGARPAPQVQAAAPAQPAEEVHDRPQLQVDYVAPRTELEERIASAWREVFGVREVGVYDSFYELGGTSLMAPRLVFKLRDRLEAEVPLNALYEAPTIADLAALLGDAPADDADVPAASKESDLWDEVALDPDVRPRQPARGGRAQRRAPHRRHRASWGRTCSTSCWSAPRSACTAWSARGTRRPGWSASAASWTRTACGATRTAPASPWSRATWRSRGWGWTRTRSPRWRTPCTPSTTTARRSTTPSRTPRCAPPTWAARRRCCGWPAPGRPSRSTSCPASAVYAPPARGEPVPEVLRESDPVDEWRRMTATRRASGSPSRWSGSPSGAASPRPSTAPGSSPATRAAASAPRTTSSGATPAPTWRWGRSP